MTTARRYAAFRVDVQLTAGVWTNITRDIVHETGIRAFRGTRGVGPLDRIADPGTMEYSLRNDRGNSGRTRSWYSPNHGSVRHGWTEGIPCRLVGTFAGVDYPLWRGKLRTIDPTPGDEPQRCGVLAQDIFGDFAETRVRAVTPQIDQTEVQIVQAILAALPAESQPVATAYDAALDSYPVALDNIGDGAQAYTLLHDVVVSAFGMLAIDGDGTFRYTNRHNQALVNSSLTLTDGDLLVRGPGYTGPSSLDTVYNRVGVTIHPKTIVASTVLFASTVAIEVSAGASVEVWDNYSDPNNRDRLIGGKNFTAPVAGVDYTANTLEDGSGSDVTSSVTVTAYEFASSMKTVFTNTSVSTVYVTMHQLRGDGIYDNSPLRVESFAAKSYGDRPLEVDLPYQNDPVLAQDFADYLRAQYEDPSRLGQEVVFDPQTSGARMIAALSLDIGDIVTASERQTGLSAIEFIVRGIEYTIEPGPFGFNLTMRLRVVPNAATSVFIFDDSDFGTFDGVNSVFGYA
jgi:hypothetical protein